MSSTRRDFLKQYFKAIGSFRIGGIHRLSPASRSVTLKKTSAADKIVIALIGCRGMGFGDLAKCTQNSGRRMWRHLRCG